MKKHSCIKYIVFACNLALFLFGFALTVLAVWVRVDSRLSGFVNDEYYRNVDKQYSMETLYVSEWAFLAIGLACLITGFFGCCGAIRDSRAFLLLYVVLLIMIFIAQLGIGVWVFIKRDRIYNELGRAFSFLVQRYGESPDIYTRVMDAVQLGFDCCGDANCGDYRDAKKEIPRTCDLNCDGCSYRVWRVLREAFLILAIWGILALIFELAAIICAFWLCVMAGQHARDRRVIYQPASPPLVYKSMVSTSGGAEPGVVVKTKAVPHPPTTGAVYPIPPKGSPPPAYRPARPPPAAQMKQQPQQYQLQQQRGTTYSPPTQHALQQRRVVEQQTTTVLQQSQQKPIGSPPQQQMVTRSQAMTGQVRQQPISAQQAPVPQPQQQQRAPVYKNRRM